MSDFDYLIVGQGLAGTVLAQTLLKNGKSFMVVEGEREHTSSKVSAGIFNPITGKRLVKTWLGEQIFPFLVQFYQSFESQLQSNFFHQIPIYLPFENQEKQNDFSSLDFDIENNFQLQFYHKNLYPDFIKGDFGGIVIGTAGWVDVKKMMESFKTYLQQNHLYIDKTFNFSSAKSNENLWEWNGQKFKKIVFCEGVLAENNALWNWLEFRSVKGEILTVRFDKKPNFQHLINRGCWVLPLENDTFRVGSTYEFHYKDDKISEQGRKEIEEKMDSLLNIKHQVIHQVASIRPATIDRRPFLGEHPEIKNIFVFNGLGTKGVSIAPFFAQHLFEHIELGKSLMDEVDVLRSWKKKHKNR
jgi:glycine/D-amino acid oxidase-like deaminating enzyme